ncbi:MAG: FHA domain-containing protein [Cyanobacteria bacterium CRU_2_1]|nr:FHA domain-containing protein [Cyanobacteria bacterium CRU_2_1]
MGWAIAILIAILIGLMLAYLMQWRSSRRSVSTMPLQRAGRLTKQKHLVREPQKPVATRQTVANPYQPTYPSGLPATPQAQISPSEALEPVEERSPFEKPLSEPMEERSDLQDLFEDSREDSRQDPPETPQHSESVEERTYPESDSWNSPADERTHIGSLSHEEVAELYFDSAFSDISDRIQQAKSRTTGDLIRFKITNHHNGKAQEKFLTSTAILEGGGLIGRHSTCDIVLNGREVSRVHARILYLEEQFHFTDLGSTGGSLVNYEKVQTNQNCLLQANDLIRIGKFTLLVRGIEQHNEQLDRPLIVKAEELVANGILSQGISELVFQDKRFIKGLSLSKRFRKKAIDLWQAELDTGKDCLLVEHTEHFTLWVEK